MASVLNQPFFQNEGAAYAKLESLVWPSGPVCPHCGCTDRVRPLRGKAHRAGLKKCYACRRQFTVKVGTVFESSHVGLHLWLQAAHLLCGSKKGISSNQLSRILGVTLKTAWFMSHRVREAMRDGTLRPPTGGFKRGMRGVHQHCAERHLHRYEAELDFRHNNRVKLGVGDAQRTSNALRGIVGTRLTYRDSFAAST